MRARILAGISVIFSICYSNVAFSSIPGEASFDVTGSISGVVIDEVSGESIPGAVVMIEGLQMGGTTDIDGIYTIDGVNPGQYNLICRLISYQPKKITDVIVEPGKSTQINVTLQTEEITIGEGNEVVIVDVRTTNSEASVLMEMKESKSVMNGIGSQQIAKSQDASASEVARRIPGVTVIDNRFVMVRGLTERYNAVLLNNAMAPSFEADVRSFSFDVMPSSMIDRFLIYKSPSPDLPGDFAGGAIRIYTKNFPEHKTFLNFDINSGFRIGTTFKAFRTNQTSSTDFLGFDNGLRDLPENFPSNVRNITDPNALQEAGRSLPNTWGYNENKAPLDFGTNLTFGKQYKYKNLLIGNVTGISYSTNYNTYISNRLDYNMYDASQNHSDTIFNYNDSIFQKQSRLGAIFNWGLKAGNHSFNIQNFINQTGTQENTFRNGVNKEEGNYRKEFAYRYNQRTIYTGQINGQHEVFAQAGKFEWNFGYSMTDRSDPDWKRIRYTKPLDGSNEIYQAYIPFGAQPFYLGRLYLEMKESTPMAAASYEHKVKLPFMKNKKENLLVLKAGSYIENKKRTFSVRNIGYASASFGTFGNADLFSSPVSEILQTSNINNVDGLKIDEDTKGSDSYSASNQLTAAYAMATLPFHHLTLSGGVRIEKNKQTLDSETLSGDPLNVILDSTFVLPSANLTYQFNDRSLVRVGYGKTVNRPEFREIAPYYFYDFVFNSIYSGNENLKVATIQNYDARYEFYPTTTEIISLGTFYKEFKDPIELYFAPGVGSGGTRSFIPGNAPSARSYGLEAEIRKSLKGIISSNVLDNFSVLFNASVIKSDIRLANQASETGINNSRPMMGQSPYMINAGIYYQNDSLDLQVSVLYNRIGERVVIVGIPGVPEVYEMPRDMFDITVTKGIGKSFAVRFGIKDLLNQDYVLLQDANEDGVLSVGTDQKMQFFNKGTQITFGLRYRFKEK